MSEFFRDFRNNLSWGRLAAAVCLAQALALAWAGRSETLIQAFLWGAFGSYGSSKAAEAWTSRKDP